MRLRLIQKDDLLGRVIFQIILVHQNFFIHVNSNSKAEILSSLWDTAYNRYCRNQEEDIFRATSDTNHASVIDGHEREDKSNSFKPIYSFGIKLEEMVEKVLASRGYLTELRKKMIEECKKNGEIH